MHVVRDRDAAQERERLLLVLVVDVLPDPARQMRPRRGQHHPRDEVEVAFARVSDVHRMPSPCRRRLPCQTGTSMDVEQLRELVAEGRIDTVICAFPDLYGRLLGKRIDAGFFLDHAVAGMHACDYLFTVDMEMEPVPGYAYANWDKGYGDVHLVPRSADAAPGDVARPDGDHPVRRAHAGPRAGRRRAAQHPEGAGRSRGGARLRGQRSAASSSTTSSGRPSRTPRAAGHRNLPAAGWYLEDYHLLQGTAHRGRQRRVPSSARGVGHPGRVRRRASGARGSTRSTSGTRACSRWPTGTSS